MATSYEELLLTTGAPTRVFFIHPAVMDGPQNECQQTSQVATVQLDAFFAVSVSESFLYDIYILKFTCEQVKEFTRIKISWQGHMLHSRRSASRVV